MNEVYVCYAQCDKEKVEILINTLESNNIHCCHDVNFSIGDYWWNKRLIQIINSCALVIPYITESAFESQEFQDEMEQIIASGQMILPVCEPDFPIFKIPSKLRQLSVIRWYILDENHTLLDLAKYVSEKLFPSPLDREQKEILLYESQYEQLNQLLLEDKSEDKAVVVLQGEAGAGKTTLVKKWLKDHEQDFTYKYYLPAGSLYGIDTYERFLERLPGLPPSEEFYDAENDSYVTTIKWDRKCLFVVDDAEAVSEAVLSIILGNTGDANVLLVTRTILSDISKYPTIVLNADQDFSQKLIDTYFIEEKNDDRWPKYANKILKLAQGTSIFVSLLSSIRDYSHRSIFEILDEVENGISIKYDLFITGGVTETSIIKNMTDVFIESGYSIINPYSQIDVISYLGDINKLPIFSKQMMIICSTDSLKQENWKNEIVSQLQTAITNGVEIIIVATDKAALDLFFETMSIAIVDIKIIEIIADKDEIVQAALEKVNNIKSKRQLISHADQYWMYGNFQDALECYTQALILAESDYDIQEMVTLYDNIAMLYGELLEFDSAIEYAIKADELSNAYSLQRDSLVDDLQKSKRAYEDRKASERTDNRDTGLIIVNSQDKYKDLHDKIANYCNAAIELFQEMIQQNCTAEGLNCVKVSYSRLMSYCKTVGGMETVVKTCIDQLDEVERLFNSESELEDKDQAEKINKSYRTYLGLETMEMENYDVFISYKSQDRLIAQRVYEYLTSYGKKVFFSCATLPEMGRDEYTDAIFEALDKSKHMALITSDIQYVKSGWVKDEWEYFLGEIREDRKSGNVILVIHDEMDIDKKKFPPQLRHKEIVKMSEFREKLLGYLP